jgi:hypothetical protein
MDDTDEIRAEIERLHRFFEDWFNGAEGLTIDEFADSLDDRFYIVTPQGTILDMRDIVTLVGSNGGNGPVAINIENVKSRTRESGGMRIVTYEEHQTRSSGNRVIISTVGLIPDSNRPGGFSWLFVHETSLAAVS